MELYNRNVNRDYVTGKGYENDDENKSAVMGKIECENSNSSARCPAGMSNNFNVCSRPKSRFYHENQRQNSMLSSINNSTGAGSSHYPFCNQNPNPILTEEDENESLAHDVEELEENLLVRFKDEDGEVDVEEEDVWWLTVLRKHENELVSRKNNYKPIVATPENLLREKQICPNKLLMIKDQCEDILKTWNVWISKMKDVSDRLYKHEEAMRAHYPEDSEHFQLLVALICETEVETEKFIRQREFYEKKKQTMEEIISVKKIDIMFVAGELERNLTLNY